MKNNNYNTRTPTMSNMPLSDSDSSSLSSLPLTEDESPMAVDEEPTGIAKYFKKEPESPPPKRSPSPPHEYVLADNPDIAFVVMFRARFSDVFPRSLPHYGPQDIEVGISDPTPGDHIEKLLCALLGLVLNRKKDIERNHYQRPLEEAISAHTSQWPKAWESKNPLQGGRTFATMTAEERLQLLRALTLWSLSSSEVVQAKIRDSYKQARHDDDLNQPLSVQPWGHDSRKRRYWLIEGQDDTHFRLYRESNPAGKTPTWWNVAGSIPELLAVADRLDKEKSQHARRLSERIRNAVPRFEASEEKRKRRDYRLARKAAFSRPEPGFSLYEGRTRGKKLKYTYSDDEDIFSDGLPPRTRRSTRNSAAVATPADPAGPQYTASGRQIRSRTGGTYGESLLTTQRMEDTDSAPQHTEEDAGRPRRSRTVNRVNGFADYSSDNVEDETEAQSSGNEWQGGDEGDEDDFEGDDSVANGDRTKSSSLMVQLRYGKTKLPTSRPNGPDEEPSEIISGAKREIGTDQANNKEQPLSTKPQESAEDQPMNTTQASTTTSDESGAPDFYPSSNAAVEESKPNQQTELNGVVQNKPDSQDDKNAVHSQVPVEEEPPPSFSEPAPPSTHNTNSS